MAEVNTGDSGEAKKGKPKKMTLRVDFTPMVDMNMLLITFFMFATSLAKPQAMEIAMPVKEDITKEEKSKVKDDKAITILLGKDNNVYYFFGMPADIMQDHSKFHAATYGGLDDANSLRTMLAKRNRIAMEKIARLKDMKDRKQIKEADYKEQVSKIKNAKDGQVVIIKPTDDCTYVNLINALDELAICSIGTYAIDNPSEGDLWLIKNKESGGKLAEESDFGTTSDTKK